MTDPKALKGTSPNHWAGVLGVQRGRGRVVLLKDTCVEQQGGVRDSKGKDKGSCRGYGDAGLSTWQGGTCLGRAPWHQVKDPLGNSYFYKRCVFIKKKIIIKKEKLRICPHFYQVFMTEQASHLLYSRALTAFLCAVWKAAGEHFKALWLALWALLKHQATSGIFTGQQRPLNPSQKTERTIMLCEPAWTHQE